MSARRLLRSIGIAARLAVLGVTACLLVATSAVPPGSYCGGWAAPVAFQAEGTCGPGGLIVLDTADGYRIRIHNGAALGLPALDVGWGASTDPTVLPTSDLCPRLYEKGDWRVSFPACPTQVGGDSGTAMVPDAGTPGAGGACTSQCQAHLSAAGQLLFTCADPQGETRCESTLKVVP